MANTHEVVTQLPYTEEQVGQILSAGGIDHDTYVYTDKGIIHATLPHTVGEQTVKSLLRFGMKFTYRQLTVPSAVREHNASGWTLTFKKS